MNAWFLNLGICWLPLAVGLSCAMPSGLLAQPQRADRGEAGDRLAEVVADLIGRLDDDRQSVRRQAEAKLVALGPEAARFLPKSDEGLSAETRHRLARIERQWRLKRIEALRLASKVTFPSKPVRLGELLQKIEAQTGNRIRIDDAIAGSLADRRLQLAAGTYDFWPAVDRLLDQAELVPYPFSQNRELLLIAAPESRLPRSGSAFYAGPFRIEPMRLEAQRDLRMPVTDVLAVQIELAWEPRLAPIGVDQPLADVRVTGEGEVVLEPAGADLDISTDVQPGATAVELRLPLRLPPRSIKRIARLSGELSVLLPGPVEALRFERLGPDGGQSRRAGDVRVLVEQVRRNGPLWEVHLRVRLAGAGQALDSHRGWMLRNPCYLVDAAGKHFQHAGFETTRQNQGEVGIIYLFDLDRDLKGMALVYETPSTILRVPVAYELRDIPLP